MSSSEEEDLSDEEDSFHSASDGEEHEDTEALPAATPPKVQFGKESQDKKVEDERTNLTPEPTPPRPEPCQEKKKKDEEQITTNTVADGADDDDWFKAQMVEYGGGSEGSGKVCNRSTPEGDSRQHASAGASIWDWTHDVVSAVGKMGLVLREHLQELNLKEKDYQASWKLVSVYLIRRLWRR